LLVAWGAFFSSDQEHRMRCQRACSLVVYLVTLLKAILGLALTWIDRLYPSSKWIARKSSILFDIILRAYLPLFVSSMLCYFMSVVLSYELNISNYLVINCCVALLVLWTFILEILEINAVKIYMQ
jgi:hypothetical protein